MPYGKQCSNTKHKKILIYFYQWYLLPLIVLHELSHYIFAKIVFTKVISFKIFKEKNEALYNGSVHVEIPTKKWKQYIISLSPLILLSPFFLMFFYNFFFYISIYIITTTVKYNEVWLNLVFPSSLDINLIKNYNYNKYVLDFFGRKKYYEYFNKKILHIKISENELLYNNFKNKK